MSEQLTSHAGTRGESPSEQVGYRNKARAWWRALTFEQRLLISLGTSLVIAILLYFVDHALSYAALIITAIYWLRRFPARYKLPGEVAFIVLLAILAIAWTTPWSLVLLVAVIAAITWIPDGRKAWGIPVAFLVLAILYPFYSDQMFTMPIFGVWPDVGTGVYMLVFVMMAVGLNIVVGYAGLLDLGYVAFYAFGAYTAAWLMSPQFPHSHLRLGAIGLLPGWFGIHITIWLVLVLAGCVTALAGIVIGLPTLRLRGDYLAIVTLGFGEILPKVAQNGDSLFGFNLTNGPNGITPLDAPGFGHHLSSWTGGFLPANYLQCCSAKVNVGFLHIHHQVSSYDVYFWTAIVLLIFTVFVSLRLQYSRLGRAWIAIREDETAAAAMGIPLMRTKTWAYASGAFFGGIAGAYYAVFKSATFPGDFYFNISVFILCMVILGGMGNIWGVIVGAAFLAYLNQEGLANTGSWLNTNIHVAGWRPNINVPLYASGIYGVIILVVMLFRPEGLIPSRRRAAELHEGVHDEPLYDHEVAGST
jgi:branched-chain amino acid transport system permease protein